MEKQEREREGGFEDDETTSNSCPSRDSFLATASAWIPPLPLSSKKDKKTRLLRKHSDQFEGTTLDEIEFVNRGGSGKVPNIDGTTGSGWWY